MGLTIKSVSIGRAEGVAVSSREPPLATSQPVSSLLAALSLSPPSVPAASDPTAGQW